eukprot:355254-Rhodomonas_salina.1
MLRWHGALAGALPAQCCSGAAQCCAGMLPAQCCAGWLARRASRRNAVLALAGAVLAGAILR